MNEFKKLIARALQEKNAELLLQEGHTTEMYGALGERPALTKGPVWSKKKLHMVLNFLHADPEMLKIAKQQGPVKARFEVPGHHTVYVISGVDTNKELWIRLFLGEDAKSQFMTSFKELSAPRSQQPPSAAVAQAVTEGESGGDDASGSADNLSALGEPVSELSEVSEDHMSSDQSLPPASLQSAEFTSTPEPVAAGDDMADEASDDVGNDVDNEQELDSHLGSYADEASQLEESYIVQSKDRSARLEKEFRDQVKLDAQMQAQAELGGTPSTGEDVEMSAAPAADSAYLSGQALSELQDDDEEEGVGFSQLSSDIYGVAADDGFYDRMAGEVSQQSSDLSTLASGAEQHHDGLDQEFEEQKLTEAEQAFTSSFQLDSDSYVGKLVDDTAASLDPSPPAIDEGKRERKRKGDDVIEDDMLMSQDSGPTLSRVVSIPDDIESAPVPHQELAQQDEVQHGQDFAEEHEEDHEYVQAQHNVLDMAAGDSAQSSTINTYRLGELAAAEVEPAPPSLAVDQDDAMQWLGPSQLPARAGMHSAPLLAAQPVGGSEAEDQHHGHEASSPSLSSPLAASGHQDPATPDVVADADRLALEGFLFEAVSKMESDEQRDDHDALRPHSARDSAADEQHVAAPPVVVSAQDESPSLELGEYLRNLFADQVREIRLVSWGQDHMQALVYYQGSRPPQVQSLMGSEAAQLRQQIMCQQGLVVIPCPAADPAASGDYAPSGRATSWAQFWLKPRVAPSGAVSMLIRQLQGVAATLPGSYQQAVAQVAAVAPPADRHRAGHLVCLSAASAYHRAQLGYGLIEEFVQPLDGAQVMITTLESQGFFTVHHGGLYAPVFLTSQPALWAQQCLDVAEYMLGDEAALSRRILFVSGLPQELVRVFVQHTLGPLLASGITVVWGLQAPSAYLGWRQISDALVGEDATPSTSLLSTVVTYMRGFIGLRKLAAPVRELAQEHLETLVLSDEHKALWQQQGAQLQLHEFYGHQNISLEAQLCAQLQAPSPSLTLAQVYGLVQHPDYVRQLIGADDEDIAVSAPVSGAA